MRLFALAQVLTNDYGRLGAAANGLGLAICKGLVEAHGGRIWAESAGPGRGTRITFTIPVTEDARGNADGDIAPGRSRQPRQTRGTTRVLIDDDDPQTLHSVRDAPPPRRLRAAPDGRPRGSSRTSSGPTGPNSTARPAAAGRRRHRAPVERPRARGPAGHLPLGATAGEEMVARGAGARRGRLHHQALLADRADGAGAGGAPPAGGPGSLDALRELLVLNGG